MRQFARMSEMSQLTVDVANEELKWWTAGPNGIPRVEAQPDARQRILEYFSVIKPAGPVTPGTPWSAAFVSYCVVEAARRTGREVPILPSRGHAGYTRDAIRRRSAGVSGYWAYRVEERPVQVADIVVVWRETPKVFEDLLGSGDLKLHGDIVSHVERKRALRIGGNVNDSVKARFHVLDERGYIDLTNPVSSKVMAILHCDDNNSRSAVG